MKKSSFDLPYRQIHLDFHTSPHIPDVGADFDAREFAATMKRAHVNSVTVFAKCHHGHLYYTTKHPARHPGLKRGLDLLGEQVEALHREGIRAPIYISVQCDEYAADNYPQWITRQSDGKPVGAGPLASGWQILDMSSPYQEYLAGQTREVLKLFRPVDGIFFDMCWDQPSLSNYAVEAMLKSGLNPESEDDRAKHARNIVRAYMKRFFTMVKASSRAASVYFNGRPYENLAEDVAYQTQVEIEALPTGGWGYIYFPRHVRYARTFQRPYLGMTARFHKSWADFGGLKPYPALEYETSQMIAHGARCSIGDQLHPRGVLDQAAYELIGKAYARIEAAEPLVRGARPLSQIGLLVMPAGAGRGHNVSGTEEGAVRMLTQLRHQFDIVGPSSDFGRYELLIVPGAGPLDDAAIGSMRAYLKRGGKVLAVGMSVLSEDGKTSLLPELGIVPRGPSPYTTTYMRVGKRIGQDVPPTDHVIYERGWRIRPGRGAVSLAQVVEPYFERTWQHFSSHFQTPPSKASGYAAAVLKGNAAYIAFPVFQAFAAHGNHPYRLLVRNILNLLIEPMLTTTAPTSMEATVMSKGRRTVIHLLSYFPERRAANLDLIEDIVPIYDVAVSLRMPQAPRNAYLAPAGQPLDLQYDGRRANLVVHKVSGHQMVVLE